MSEMDSTTINPRGEGIKFLFILTLFASSAFAQVNLTAPPPQEATITVNAVKPSGATIANVVMTVFDADFTNEGVLYINGNAAVNLFPQVYPDASTQTLTFPVNVSWVNNGANTLRFTHTNTGGYRVDAVSFTFSGITTCPPYPDTTGLKAAEFARGWSGGYAAGVSSVICPPSVYEVRPADSIRIFNQGKAQAYSTLDTAEVRLGGQIILLKRVGQ